MWPRGLADSWDQEIFGVSRFSGLADFWGQQILGVGRFSGLQLGGAISSSALQGFLLCLERVPALSLFNSLLKLLSPFGSGRSQWGWNRLSISSGNSGQLSRGQGSLNRG